MIKQGTGGLDDMQKTLLFICLMIISGCVEPKQDRSVKISESSPIQKNSSHQIYNFGNYYALLIYVDDYTHLTKLETPRYDVESVSKILKERYGFNEPTIISNPKNSDELVAILDKLSKKMGENDNLLIYYAGHGHYIKKGDVGFWQLKDAHIDSRVGWISVKQAINFTLNQMSAKHILVVSDSCYSGAILRRSSGADLSNSRDDAKYYSAIYQKKSRNALTSGGMEPVLDSDPSNPNHSVFTNGFLHALKKNKNSIFTLEEKFPEIKRYVQLKSDAQIPLYADIAQTGHDMGGDFIFLDRSIKGEKPLVLKPSTKKKVHGQMRSSLDEPKRYYRLGLKSERSKKQSEAMDFYRQSCDLKYGAGCAKLGLIHNRLGNERDAIISLSKACALGIEKACFKEVK